MSRIVQVILDHWAFGVCVIAATFITILTGFPVVFNWLYRRFATDHSRKTISLAESIETQSVVSLTSRHCDAPEDFGYLKGTTVKATGLAMRTVYDRHPPTIELYSFPFKVAANIVCEFPEEKARTLRDLPFRRLVSVIGAATDGIKVDIQKRAVDLTLVDCRLVKPPFGVWLQYLLHEITSPFRWWWFWHVG
jgi:hypothetical protein